MLRGLVDVHAMTELPKQHGHARALGGEIVRIMCQYVKPVAGIGEQEVEQSPVTGFRVVTQAVVVLLKQIEIVLREFAKIVQRFSVIDDAVKFGVLQSRFSHDHPRCFFPQQDNRPNTTGKL